MGTIKKIQRLSAIVFTIVFLQFSNTSYAQGPNAPEASGFEPVDATDMVNLTNGNFSYVLPLLEVEGFPLSLSYHAGITPDLEASWVGLGWYLNTGSINRSINGSPDDWKEGIGINFTSFDETKTYYSVTVSAQISPGISVGVGANWGGGQGLSGSVQANLMGISAHADTQGNAGVGLQTPIGGMSFANSSKPKYNVAIPMGNAKEGGSVGYSDGTISAGYNKGKSSVGFSLSGSGNFSVGGTNSKGAGGNVSSSSSSESHGDATIDTKSVGISITVPVAGIPITLGLRKTKVRISIRKGYENKSWGALYASEYNDFSNEDSGINSISNSQQYTNGFNDYMSRNNALDIYSTRLPQSEQEFIGDYSKKIENINFTSISYDDYNVNAQGLMGSLTPRVFQNANIIGKGERTENEAGDPIHVFWHHGNQNNNIQRSLTDNSKPFNFYFDGQFTSTEINDGNIFDASNLSTLNMNDYFIEGTHNGAASNYERARQGNYVEVFTNQEIANNQALGLITPKEIPNNLRGNNTYFDPNGIGAYKVTSTDGKTYHFSLPVYHYEKIHRNQLEEQEHQTTVYSPPFINNQKYDCKNVQERRQFTRYATHWLLTAVTGPDYIDSNNNGRFDKTDYGYWVELEYGKWSDGFVWRTPFQDFVYDYNTNVKGDIEDQDKGHYSFGRKQVYYLDKITTKNRAALFVKNIRYDNYGKELNYKFLNKNNSGDQSLGNSGHGTNENSLNFTNPNIDVLESDVSYEREYSLKLERIILIDSDNSNLIDKSGESGLGNLLPNYTANSQDSPNWMSSYFEEHYGANYVYPIHQEQNVLDVGDVPLDFIEEHALKVIEFNHDYQLVKNSPTSMIVETSYGENEAAGKLTLQSVKKLGKGGTDFIPPTSFSYYDSDDISNPNFLPYFSPLSNDSASAIQDAIEQRHNFVDSWGYMQGEYNYNGQTRSRVDLWSLKEITAPTGASIKVDYEEDDYWIEAFSRRFWENGIQAKFTQENGKKYVYFRQHPDEISNEEINFTSYFEMDDKVFLDIQYHRNPTNSGHGRRIADFAGSFTISSVTSEELKIELPIEQNSSSRTGINCGEYPWSYSSYYCCTSHLNVDEVGYISPMGGSPCDFPSNGHTNFRFKLLANKVPENETGGGIRVKEVITSANNRVYKTQYDYRHPTKNRSSGITSYAPVNGIKYIPYQSEIPAPGVMYEYVTMKETDANGEYNSETRYRHHVLKPVFNIFNPNIEMEALESDAPGEDKIFRAKVTDAIGGLDGNNSKKAEAKKIEIEINNAMIGQLKSVEIFNREKQLLNKIEHQYVNGKILSGEMIALDGQSYEEPNKGYVKETFNSMKTVFQSSNDGTIIEDVKRLLSISSKTEYNNMLKKTITIAGGQKSSITYFDVDPWLGSFRRSETTMADGTLTQRVKMPAYTKYPELGSKVNNPNNKNMLTQEAMLINSVKIANQWRTLNASITTWNNNWTYRDYQGNEPNSSTETPVWRKHKTFVWKDEVNTNGDYVTLVDESNDYFNWGIGSPTSNKWQKASEITRYTHWSAPIESKDINGNFASSKMADVDSKVIAGGNARYTEMYYSGAENAVSDTYFDGEIQGAQYLTDKQAHTGSYSLEIVNSSHKAFHINGQVGLNENDLTKKFRPGKYKVSIWVNNTVTNNSQDDSPRNRAVLKMNGQEIFPKTSIIANDWIQLNYIIDVYNTLDLYVTSSGSSSIPIYIDDFRMHPIYASMNSYVYDNKTSELISILDANNLATKFIYDKAGRLSKTYKEVVNDENFIGGFKLTNQYHYNYKN